MIAYVVQEFEGWWGGVLHPFVDSDHLITMLVVGVLAGIAVQEGRDGWVGPLSFVAGTLMGVIAATLGVSIPGIEGAIVAGLVIAVALLFVPPPRMSAVLPLAALLGGVLSGLSYHDSSAGTGHLPRYAAGFVFATCILQAFATLAGTAIGRSLAARRTVAVFATIAAVVALA